MFFDLHIQNQGCDHKQLFDTYLQLRLCCDKLRLLLISS